MLLHIFILYQNITPNNSYKQSFEIIYIHCYNIPNNSNSKLRGKLFKSFDNL